MSQSHFETLHAIDVELRESIAIVHLNRPEKRNAVNVGIVDGLVAFFGRLDASKIKGVVIAGRGDHFCAGADLSEMRETNATEGLLHSYGHQQTFRQIQYAPVPVVSVLRGAVIGAGFEMASATHIRVAEPTAYYALPEGQRGIFLGAGGSVRITRLIGLSRVMDMMMTGRTYNADEGYQFGFSQYLVGEGEGLDKAIAIAQRAASNSSLSNFAMIHALPRILEMGPEEGLFAESLMTGIAQNSPEAKARLAAFLEKRANKIVSE